MTKQRNRRKAKVVETPRDKNTPVIAEDPNKYKKRHPIWSFSGFRCDDEDWGVGTKGKTKVNDELLPDILRSLKSFEGMQWGEIEKQTHDRGKSSNHWISRDRLSKMTQNKLKQEHLDDIEELYSLRLNNMRRLLGVREGEVFVLYWIVSDHSSQ